MTYISENIDCSSTLGPVSALCSVLVVLGSYSISQLSLSNLTTVLVIVFLGGE